MMRLLLLAAVCLAVTFGLMLALTPSLAADAATVYGVLFLSAWLPLYVHFERHRR